MNKDNIRKWIDALRSGQYKQGKFLLASEKDEFCCLGVACEVAIREGAPVVKTTPYADPFAFKGAMYDGAQTTLPQSVRDWLGLDADIAQTMLPDLMKLNDIRDYTFPQIADYIEKEIPNESDRQS